MYWAKDMLFKIVLPVAIQNFFIAYIAHIVFLLDSTVLEYSLVFFFFSCDMDIFEEAKPIVCRRP